MKVNPINTINSLTTFKANIQPTQSLKDGFNMIERSVNSIITKDMDYAKDFLNSIAEISESKKIDNFKIEIDKRRPGHTYTKINGRRVSGGSNESFPYLQDSYLVVEGTKKYAARLKSSEHSEVAEHAELSYLDILKTRVEDAQRLLDEAKMRYSERLKSEFEQAKKIIFNDVK